MIYKNCLIIIASIFSSLTFCCTSQPKSVTNDSVPASTDYSNVIDTISAVAAGEVITDDSLIFPDNEKSIVQILQTGKLDPLEVDKNAARQKWVGMFKIGTMYFLRPTTLELMPTTDTNANIIRQVVMVNTSLLNRCVILISGLSELTKKDLQTAQRNKDTVFPNDELAIKFKDNIYSIKAEGKLQQNNDGTFQIKSYKLFLTASLNGAEIKQLLVAQPLLKNEMISIIWTGDLDGDNKLDLIINASPTKGYSTPALYLSSKAGQGELVKFVGQHFAK
ncbi:MAG: hypothetical protein ABI723_21010 [Bacteroidia bacterium]